jgi:hypothetical protein
VKQRNCKPKDGEFCKGIVYCCVRDDDNTYNEDETLTKEQ